MQTSEDTRRRTFTKSRARDGIRILMTGGGGSLAGDIIPGLLRHGHEIWAVDHTEHDDATGSNLTSAEGTHLSGALHRVTRRIGDPEDAEGAEQLFAIAQKADVIIHLAGIPLEDEWEALLCANVALTRSVLQLAVEASVPRLILASSIHAVGFTDIPRDGELLPADIVQNPNTLYGTTKASCEALARYYVNHFNLEVLNVRICSRTARPIDQRMLSTWLSPTDAVRLFHAGSSNDLPEPFWTVWGVSANSRSWFDQGPGADIGFSPTDDAEDFAERIAESSARSDFQEEGAAPWQRTIGGIFSSPHPPRMKGR